MKRTLIVTILVFLPLFTIFAGELNFAEFQYITAYEETVFGEKIKFFNGDTLWGWIHSNGEIAIMQSPVFFGPITSCARDFWHGPSYNPVLYQAPIFDYPEAEFPTELTELRDVAQQQGTYFFSADSQFRILFKGEQGFDIFKWPLDIHFADSIAATIYQSGIPLEDVVFIDGELEMLGTDPELRIDYGIAGRITVGCSGNVRIIDNLRYVDSDLHSGAVDSSTINCLGLVSEAYILIANTPENGKDNGGNLYPYDTWRSSVIINGAVLAFGESFSFEDQNDDTTTMGGQLPSWYYSYGSSPDERGQIRLWGTIAQYRRGYVHRSNNGGTGYLKNYHYYYGLAENPPPYFPYLPSDISFSADTLNFGVVTQGDTSSMDLLLFNQSMDSISVISSTYSDPAFSGITIQDSLFCPNDSCVISLEFHPQSAGTYNESFTMQTDAGTYTIALLGECIPVGVSPENPNATPDDFQFITARPNPFNDRTALEFVLSKGESVALNVYNISGSLVSSCDFEGAAGMNQIYWQPENLSAGIYFFRIQAGMNIAAGKLLYLK